MALHLCGMEAFLVSASNPKTLVFFCAFLPQFLEPGRPIFGLGVRLLNARAV